MHTCFVGSMMALDMLKGLFNKQKGVFVLGEKMYFKSANLIK